MEQNKNKGKRKRKTDKGIYTEEGKGIRRGRKEEF
jgi:hypothetical protein